MGFNTGNSSFGFGGGASGGGGGGGISFVTTCNNATFSLYGDGTAGSPLNGCPIISACPNNALSVCADGLYSSASATISTCNTNTFSFYGDGSVGNPLCGCPQLSTFSNQGIIPLNDGLWSPNPIRNGLVYGGVVTWLQNYDYSVSPAGYYINGVFYTSPQTTVTLSPSNPTLDRIDLFVVTTSGTATSVTGTPSNPPQSPTLDPNTQLEISFALVTAGSTQPAITSQYIYFNNAEWTTSASSPTINPASTSNPFSAPLDVEFTNAPLNANITFTTTPFVILPTYQNLILYIRSKATFPTNRRLLISFRNGATTIGSGVVLTGNSITYAFDSTITGAYQRISIPLTNFGLANNITIDNLRIAVSGTAGSGNLNLFIDNIEIQSGTPPPDPQQNIYVPSIGFCSTIRCNVNNSALSQFSSSLSGRCNNVNTGSNYSSILSGCRNTINNSNNSVILGGICNVNNGSNCGFIGSGFCNNISGSSASLISGKNNIVQGDLSFVGNGVCNNLCNSVSSCLAVGSVIVGGVGNNTTGGTWNLATCTFTVAPTICNIGAYSFTGGGFQNLNLSDNSFIGGGESNIVNKQQSVVVGGILNCANGISSFVGGGRCNHAHGLRSTVVGGCENDNNAIEGFIGGGNCNNTFHNTNGCLSYGAVVVGGVGNNTCGGTWSLASCRFTSNPTVCDAGQYSFIGGGFQNIATGCFSSTLGGCCNYTIGSKSATVSGYCNLTNGGNSSILGGFCNLVSSNQSIISGGFLNIISSAESFIGSGLGNISSGNRSVIVGGRNQISSETYGFIGNGDNNIVRAYSGVIVGGVCNNICNSTSSCLAVGSVIVGGVGNNTTGGTWNLTNCCFSVAPTICNVGQYSFIGGGFQNIASSNNNFVGGGFCNCIALNSDYSFIGSGFCNLVSGCNSLIVGGCCNNNLGLQNLIVGGKCNLLCNTTSDSIIVGGRGNCILNSGTSIVVGGSGNTSNSSNYSVILGGLVNCTLGDFSASISGLFNYSFGVQSFIGGGNANNICNNVSPCCTIGAVVVGGIGNNTCSGTWTLASCCFTTPPTRLNSGRYSFIGGGFQNHARGEADVVVGGVCNGNVVNSNGNNFIGGGFKNTIQQDSGCGFIGGGECNIVGCWSAVAGGICNKADNNGSFVGAGCCNVATEIYSAVVSGLCNNNKGLYSFIGSGACNCIFSATDYQGVIVGGNTNLICNTQYSFIGGGELNIVTGGGGGGAGRNAIVGGRQNTINNASGSNSFIGGGCLNSITSIKSLIVAGQSNTVSGDCAMIMGGCFNVSSGTYSIVNGGNLNTASAVYSTVINGCCNLSNAVYGFIGTGSFNTLCNSTSSCLALGSVIVGGIGNNTCGGTWDLTGCCWTILPTKCNTGLYSFIGGGFQNRAGDLQSVSVGGFCNYSLGFSSAILGGCLNCISSGISGRVSVIGGGFRNCVSSNTNFIGGGGDNSISAFDSVIVGGLCNNISGATAQTSFIGGGSCNCITNCRSVIGGGVRNCAIADYSSTFSGYFNASCGYGSVVVGGERNINQPSLSFVGGGENNIICNLTNQCCALGSVIVGGVGNNTSGGTWDLTNCCFSVAPTVCNAGQYTFIGGGFQNRATGNRSAILGGQLNDTCGFADAQILGSCICATQGCTTFTNCLSAGNLTTGCFVCVASNGVISNVAPPENYVLTMGYTSTDLLASTTYYAGIYFNTTACTTPVPSRRIIVPRTGFVKAIGQLTNVTGTKSSSTPNVTMRIRNVTSATNCDYATDSFFSSGGLTSCGRNDLYTFTGNGLSVTAGDLLEIQIITPAWVTAPIGTFQMYSVYINNL